MPAPEKLPSRQSAAPPAYYYRRELGARELMAAIGVAVGAGLVAFYVARLLLQRTPIRVDRSGPPSTSASRTGGRGGIRRVENVAGA